MNWFFKAETYVQILDRLISLFWPFLAGFHWSWVITDIISSEIRINKIYLLIFRSFEKRQHVLTGHFSAKRSASKESQTAEVPQGDVLLRISSYQLENIKRSLWRWKILPEFNSQVICYVLYWFCFGNEFSCFILHLAPSQYGQGLWFKFDLDSKIYRWYLWWSGDNSFVTIILLHVSQHDFLDVHLLW